MMKSVIILALLCCSYAVEQHSEATKVPQELKDFVEQHIKNVKKQVPIVQQLIKDGKLKVEHEKPIVKAQKLPENTQEIINSPINNIPLVSPTVVSLPPFVVEKINKLQDHVRKIMKQAETHITQVINQQIAKKKEMANQAKPEEVTEKKASVEVPQEQQVVQPHLSNRKTRSIKEDVKVPEHVKDIVSQVQQHVPQVINQHVAKDQIKNGQEQPIVPNTIQDIVTQAHQHISQAINQQIAQVQQQDVADKPIIPADIQGIVTEAHQHVQQVVNQEIEENIQKKLDDGQQFTEIVNTHVILNKDAQEPTDIKSIVTRIEKVKPHSVDKNSDLEPSRVQEITQQVVPVKNAPEVPQHVHDVVSLISHHIPQVINHQIAMQKENEDLNKIN